MKLLMRDEAKGKEHTIFVTIFAALMVMLVIMVMLMASAHWGQRRHPPTG